MEGAALLLLGNKTDCEEARQVPTEAGQQLAQVSGRWALAGLPQRRPTALLQPSPGRQPGPRSLQPAIRTGGRSGQNPASQGGGPRNFTEKALSNLNVVPGL